MAEKQPKRKLSEEHKLKKKSYHHERAKTRVNIGVTFRRWRELRKLKGLKTDAEVGVFLLDRWMDSGRHRPDAVCAAPSQQKGKQIRDSSAFSSCRAKTNRSRKGTRH